jgi:hypothetical protein
MPAPDVSVRLTHLHDVDAPGAEFATLTQYSDLSITRVVNDISTARVTVSQYDDIVLNLQPFRFALKIFYGEECIFWAPANIEDDYGDGTCLISAGDIQQLEHHYIRIGDSILTITDPDTGLTDEGWVSPSYYGIQGILECSYNTPAQDVAQWPPPGIAMGDNFAALASIDENIKVERGMEVLSTMKSIAEPITGIDFVAKPFDDPLVPVYCMIDIYDEVVRDRSEDILLAYGSEGDNLTGLSVSPLFPKTVAHVLDQPPLHRQTSVNGPAAEAVGAWVHWEATDIKVDDGDVSPLIAIADTVIQVYGFPLRQVSVEMRPDAGQTVYYGWEHDYIVGDVVSISGVRGNRSVSGTHQITQVELNQSGWRGLVTSTLTLIPGSNAQGQRH